MQLVSEFVEAEVMSAGGPVKGAGLTELFPVASPIFHTNGDR